MQQNSDLSENIKQEICKRTEYGQVIMFLRDQYSKDKVIKNENNYTVGDLIDALRRFRSSEVIRMPNLVTTEGNLRWAVMTLEMSLLIQNSDDLKSAADVIETNYVQSKHDIYLISKSNGEFECRDLVRDLRNIADKNLTYNLITSNCEMREFVKNTHENNNPDNSNNTSQKQSERNVSKQVESEHNSKIEEDGNSRELNKKVLRDIVKKYRRIDGQKTINKFNQKIEIIIEKRSDGKKGEDVILYKGKQTYTLADLHKGIEHILEESNKSNNAENIKELKNWSKYRKYITSEAQLRERVGKLHIQNDKNSDSNHNNNFI